MPLRCPARACPLRWRARLVARLSCLLLTFLPHPPDPLPLRGRGCPKVYFAGGFAPGTPALNRLRHLQILPYRCLAGSWLFCGTGFRRPGKAPRLGFQRALPVPRPFSPRGCKGRSPLHKKTQNLPLPAGKGGGGMGVGKQAKGGVSGQPKRQAPIGYLFCRFSPCRFRLRRGDARGKAPCTRKPKISPFPAGEGGRGAILPLRGRGAEKQAKGGVGRREKKQATPANPGMAW